MTTHDPAEGGTALGRCIAITPGEFAQRYWGSRPLLTTAADLPGGFADLFDAEAVDRLVAEQGLRTPFARMARSGRVLPSSDFTGSGGAGASIGDQLSDDRVLARITEGSTLVLQALHRTWPPLVRFASRLAEELGHPVQINAYVTPPANQGFSPHYDVHDVIVLQIAGRKRWTIHEPVVVDPLEGQHWETVRAEVTARARTEPLIDAVLAPGDALYLPRGTIHSAAALGETSIHLTIGVHPITRRYLVERIVEQLTADPQLRTSLPVGVDLSDPEVLAPEVAATVDAARAALERLELAPIADSVGERLLRDTRPEPAGPLRQLEAAATLTPGTPLRLRQGLRYRLVGDQLQLRGRSMPVPNQLVMKTVLGGEVFCPADLGGLDRDDALAFAAELLRRAVVVPA